MITLLSLPIFSRPSVGGACLTIEKRPTDGAGSLLLRFLAGSWPERAAGLNRFGYIEESIWDTRFGRETDCFGFMTSSPEKELASAKDQLGKAPAERASLDVMRIRGKAGRFQVAEWRELIPSSYRWTECDEISARLRAIPPGTGLEVKHRDVGAAEANTFLNAVHQAILAPSEKETATFVHCGTVYRLLTHKQPDRDAGRSFEKKNLAASAERVMRLTGKIRSLATGENSTFRLWFEQGLAPAFPIRFEFHARSFLRLAFEQELQSTTLHHEEQE